ncbi:tRNA pseudouridine(38-40) synthase TruA [Spelaeicoccus albus]|uniref:tRNA pseudouridine synthase A n=1 Tax=Spelaeicoccus albus TaxID=1280376 RepID=A0A7Z0D1B7_9MICO|nr:tRNA pseudouridine(38-40) synthase TruA [Spelaeicoccus albus]NYI65815.1 tRNA pseudouridine38-40 synthase [Spelaeicoccus albus]
MRLRVDVAYDGTDFAGWARQPGMRTVEGCLGDAFALVTREPIRMTVAGRTDAGVHARRQVVHVDLGPRAEGRVIGRTERPIGEALVRRLTGALAVGRAPDIAVLDARVAPPEFDARFGALWRRYSYRIADRPQTMDPLRRHDTLHVKFPLDIDAMNASAEPLAGHHDFLSFCKPREGATTFRTLLEFRFDRQDDGVVAATIKADAFCHHMVRALIGACLAVGGGRENAAWPARLLARASRELMVNVAPAHGLCLDEVAYPPDAELAARAHATRARRG